MTCKHWEGDTVNGYWLCAKCFTKLAERPVRYFNSGVEDGDIPPRQEAVQAPIAEADDMTLGKFVEAMALRLIARTRGGFQRPDALDYAVEILRLVGEQFASKDMDWSTAGAFDLVDEDLLNWDADEAAPN